MFLFCILSSWAGAQQAHASHSGEPPSEASQGQNAPAAGANEHSEEKPAVTHHRITMGGKALACTATAARMPIKNEQGHTKAEMFYVAYTLDGAPGSKRPLTIAFNSGPGSATIWLHMGCFGPKRVKMLPNGFLPPPFTWEDNENTILDKNDLVFVDAIGTGYSRTNTPELGKNSGA